MTKSKQPSCAKGSDPMDLAVVVSNRVEIRSIRLLESTARLSVKGDDLPTLLKVTFNVETVANKESLSICVRPWFCMVAKYSREDADEAIRIEGKFELLYSVPSLEGVENENLTAFGELNGVFNAWPYWREFVQSMTARMGLPTITMPVHRPSQLKREPSKGRVVKKSRTTKKQVYRDKRTRRVVSSRNS